MSKKKYIVISLLLILFFSLIVILYYLFPSFIGGVIIQTRSVPKGEILSGNDSPSAKIAELSPWNKININTASADLLSSLPGIGKVTAEEIEKYRSENGPFSSIEEIKNVPGIGNSRFEGIKDYIFIG